MCGVCHLSFRNYVDKSKHEAFGRNVKNKIIDNYLVEEYHILELKVSQEKCQ